MLQLEKSFEEYLESKHLLNTYTVCIEKLKVGDTIHYSQYTKERAIKNSSDPLFTESRYSELNNILIKGYQQLSAMLPLPCNYLSNAFKVKAKEIFTDYNGTLLTNSEFEELLKRFQELNLTIHQLLDTKICFIDTETTGLDSSRLPIQIAYMVVDPEFNLIDCDNFYIEQEYIDPGASEVNGITVEKLKELSAAQPSEALERFNRLIETYKPIFIAHNAKFDRDTIINLYRQCGKEPNLQSLQCYCTFFNSGAFSHEKGKGTRKLTRLAEINSISDTDVQEYLGSIKLFSNRRAASHAHDALYDVVMLYLLSRKVKLLGVPKN